MGISSATGAAPVQDAHVAARSSSTATWQRTRHSHCAEGTAVALPCIRLNSDAHGSLPSAWVTERLWTARLQRREAPCIRFAGGATDQGGRSMWVRVATFEGADPERANEILKERMASGEMTPPEGMESVLIL